jgi:hypothetical protein
MVAVSWRSGPRTRAHDGLVMAVMIFSSPPGMDGEEKLLKPNIALWSTPGREHRDGSRADGSRNRNGTAVRNLASRLWPAAAAAGWVRNRLSPRREPAQVDQGRR